ncbi:MAG: suppressor of fused domain protein [Anaerolineae bacterium]|nr:suppressor of fused domain protein [Anaerolineae bacterium]
MAKIKVEQSSSGNPVYRYAPVEQDLGFVAQDGEAIERIEAHIAKYLGKPATVYHEMVSEQVHIDVHVIAPRAGKDYYTLVTTGMSDKPMHTPAGAEQFRYAELLICLPPDWVLTGPGAEHESNYWPVRWLKTLARFPHQYESWLGPYHTLPNDDPPQRYAPNTKLCCALLSWPQLCEPAFSSLEINSDKRVHFYSFIPIYKEEIKMKLNQGSEVLFEHLAAAGVSELLDPQRPNVAKRGWFGKPG